MHVTEITATELKWPDYLVIAAVLCISTSIGLYYRFSGGRQKTGEEYFLANRSMSVPVLAVTLMVAFISAISLLGGSSEVYNYGGEFAIITIGYVIATPIVAFIYLPVFYNLHNMSVYEYLERRFGSVASLAASLANFFQMGLYTGVALYAPALALDATSGISSTTSILLIGIICTFYSSIGGIKAVLATDVFQGALMVASVLCIIGIGCYDVQGGISAIFSIAIDGNRLNMFKFDPDPTVRHTWWTLTIGGISFFVSVFAINQIHVQRLLSARSLKSAQLSIFLNTPLLVLMALLISLSGLVLYAWFEGCDPMASGRIFAVDQVMPYFAKIRLAQIPGLLGFFIAGIFSASLSTISAMLNALSAIAVADYVKPIYRKYGWQLTDAKTAYFGKILCVVNGLLCVSIAFAASDFGTLSQVAIGMSGAIGGPILGLFSLGMFVEIANEIGAVIGTVVSLGFVCWITFGQPRPQVPRLPVSIDMCSNSSYPSGSIAEKLADFSNADDSEYFYLYRVSYLLYNPLGIIITLLVGSIASIVVRFFSKDTVTQSDPDLFTPILAARIRRRRNMDAVHTCTRVESLKLRRL